MPTKIHVAKAFFLVLCSSILALHNGCSNSGGNAEAPASNGNAINLSLSTTSGSTAVVADGHSIVPIRLQVTNGAGAAMSGVSVTFATTAGVLSVSPVVRATRDFPSADRTAIPKADSNGSVTVTTDTNGLAQVLLTASTTAETVTVTADVLGFRTNIVINFVPGASARVQLDASPTSVNAGSTSTLTTTVTDANGNPVPGVTVTFTFSTNTSGATLSAGSRVTDSNGQATVTYTAGSTPGGDTVRALATSTSVEKSTSITVTVPSGGSGPQTGSVASITLGVTESSGTANDNIIQADGSATATITARLLDASSRPVSNNVIVNFSTTLGIISSQATTAGGNGQATATFTAGSVAGKATVTATSGTVTGSVVITLAAGSVNSLVLRTISNTAIGVRGSGTNETSNLTFEARDSNGNLVQDPLPGNTASGTVVSFTLDNGGLGGGESLSPLRVTAVNGQVTTTLQSGTKAGTVKVIAFIDGTEIASQAISVVITSGPPWGENLGIAVQKLNISGLVTAGLTDNVTAFLSDRFSNPVPDGTAVSFFSDPPSITGAAVSHSSGGTTVATATAIFTSTPQVPFPPDSLATVIASTLSGSEARVLSLAVDPMNADVVYAGTDGGGVFRTTNGLNANAAQVSWTQVGRAQMGLTNGIVRALKIDPTRTNIIYAATDTGVFRSIGSGDTWEKQLNTPRVTALALDSTNISDPATNRTLYAGTQAGGVFRSINSGFSWAAINNGLGDTNVLSLVALSPNTLYAGTFGSGVFRTVNATAAIPAWSQVNNGLTSNVINTLATDGTRVYAGTFLGGVFFLMDGTVATPTWTEPSTVVSPVTNHQGVNVNTKDILNSFVSDIVIDPNSLQNPPDRRILYAATLGDGTQNIEHNAAEGGVFMSIDSGITWTRIPEFHATAPQLALPPADLPNNRAASLGISRANSNALYVGVAGRNVVRLTPSTAIFIVINGTPPNQLTNNIFASTTILFSGNTSVIISPSSCPSSIPIGGSQPFTYLVSDQNGNPITGGSTVTVTASAGLVTGNTSITIPDTQRGSTVFNVTLQNNTTTTVPLPITLTVDVNSPLNGNKTGIASCLFIP